MVARARGRDVEARRAEEAAEVVAALQHAEGVPSSSALVLALRGQREALQAELGAACSREEALRAALLTVMGKLRRAEAAAAEAGPRAKRAEQATVEAEQRVRDLTTRLALAEHATCAALERARVAETERDQARALQDAADRELARLRRPKRLTPPPAPPVAPQPRAAVEPVGQVTGAEVRLWVRQTRSLAALRDVPAERWDRDDAAPLRRQVFRLQQQAPGAGRAAMSERALDLARLLGGA